MPLAEGATAGSFFFFAGHPRCFAISFLPSGYPGPGQGPGRGLVGAF